MQIGNGHDILMIDDSEIDILICKTFYEKSGFQNNFLAFSEPGDLYQHMKKVGASDIPVPECIFIDVNMPLESGFEVLHNIKTIDKFKNLPYCFMLSNSDRKKDIERAVEYGAKSFLKKDELSSNDFFTMLNDLVRDVASTSA